jgi:hypothetical protein
MSPHTSKGDALSIESNFCSACSSFLHTYNQFQKPDTIYVDGPLQTRVMEGCEICTLVQKSMGSEIAHEFDSPDFHLSTTYMWILEESFLHLYFNQQIELPDSEYIRSVTILEQRFDVEAGESSLMSR